MITGLRSQFEARCRQRGYTLADVQACIVAEDGDTITVDETHPAYPRQAAPSLTRRAMNFAAAAAQHVAAGMPLADQAEIDRRHAICQQCQHFDGRACRECGCPVVRERHWRSKLSWAGQACPVGKWGAVGTTVDTE
jgi:hypothetical protein